MSKENTRVVIVEGCQGVGKSTVSREIALKLPNSRAERGIPSGDDLFSKPEQDIWLATRNRLERALAANNGITFFDRQFPSLIAYQMRTKTKHSDLIFNIGRSFFSRRLDGHKENGSLMVIGLESDVETCLSRQGEGKFAVCREELECELKNYERVFSELAMNGFSVLRFRNDSTLEELENEIINSIGGLDGN